MDRYACGDDLPKPSTAVSDLFVTISTMESSSVLSSACRAEGKDERFPGKGGRSEVIEERAEGREASSEEAAEGSEPRAEFMLGKAGKAGKDGSTDLRAVGSAD